MFSHSDQIVIDQFGHYEKFRRLILELLLSLRTFEVISKINHQKLCHQSNTDHVESTNLRLKKFFWGAGLSKEKMLCLPVLESSCR